MIRERGLQISEKKEKEEEVSDDEMARRYFTCFMLSVDDNTVCDCFID